MEERLENPKVLWGHNYPRNGDRVRQKDKAATIFQLACLSINHSAIDSSL